VGDDFTISEDSLSSRWSPQEQEGSGQGDCCTKHCAHTMKKAFEDKYQTGKNKWFFTRPNESLDRLNSTNTPQERPTPHVINECLQPQFQNG
jgi:hypothetical protein